MSIKESTGNIAEVLDVYEVVAQGNNCFGRWGAGVAKDLKPELPKTYLMDRMMPAGDPMRLGTIACQEEDSGIIGVCCYTQYRYSWDDVQVADLVAIEQCALAIKRTFSGKKIAMTRLGCGLGGADWDTVKQILEVYLGDEDVTVYSL